MSRLNKSVLQTISKHQMLSPGDRVLCCVSGGADSVAMLHVLLELAEALEVSLFAIHVNHGLRGEESERDEAFVRMLCETLGVTLAVRRLQLSKEHSIEETARKMRYQAFYEVAEAFSCNRIATAHTEDDNAETVLLHLARGSGLHGLTGIPAVRKEIIRPLLDSSRSSVLSYLQENKIDYCEDSSNTSVAFARNRIRHRVLPELLKINTAAISSIAKTAMLLKRDEDYLLEEAQRWMSYAVELHDTWRYPCSVLLQQHDAIRSRVILQLMRNALNHPSYSVESAKFQKVIGLLSSDSPSAELQFTSGLLVRRVYDHLEFSKEIVFPTEACFLHEGESCRFGRFIVKWHRENETKIHKNFMLYELDSAIIGDCIQVRSRRTGDQLKLQDRHTKSVKRWMIMRAITATRKDGIS